MSHSTTHSAVFSIIEDELDLFSTLYEILETQQQYILSRDGQKLTETAQAISELLKEAQQYRLERSRHLNMAGFNNTPEEMTRFCQQHGSAGHQEDWQELVTLVETCQSLNLKNGEALRIQHKHAEKQLQRLASRQPQSCYSAKGQAISHRGPSIMAQA